jgi:hypothetical protein
MRRVLLLVAVVSVSIAIYFRISVHAQTPLEFEYTTTDNAGMLNGTVPADQPTSVTKTYFRRADGTSGYMIREKGTGQTVTTVHYRIPKQKAEVAVQVDGNLRTTYPVPEAEAKAWASPPVMTDCHSTYRSSQLIGWTELSGVSVQKLRLVNSEMEAEYYVAPSLSCATLEAHHKWKNAKGVFVSWTNEDLVDLKIGPPNPAYFDLDSGAREAEPSEARALIQSLLHPGEPIPEGWQKANTRLDAMHRRRLEAAARGWVPLPKQSNPSSPKPN